ncbi:hypothetical protein SDC9_83611 [bioreactor metagenome]|uniref:Uncharacterized protein n=1 Tax=bioreactor metagenome TaxID=1076179 RepID=A0A644Z8M5_9ZZZZ|nr:hypothetical protein [Oscillospiraceae bacterium]
MIEYNIRYGSSNPSKLYTVNDLECLFFENLFSKFKKCNLNNKTDMIRMSDGTLTVNYSGCPIGKIKLQGKNYWMQILTSLYDHEIIEGNIQVFIPKIDDWIKYINNYLKG